MSGQIHRAPSTNPHATIAAKRRPCEVQSIALSKRHNLFAEDQFIEDTSTREQKNTFGKENSPERPFSRRRHRYFFRWREARNFFRRMLFSPDTTTNKSSTE